MADGEGCIDPDRGLVERAQTELPYGTRAYGELVHRHSAAVYRRCYRILRSEADAQEATQDVFLAVFRSLPRFRFERPFDRWLSTVTLNACRMVLRRRAQEQRRREAVGREPLDEGAQAPEPGLRALVLALLDAIDPGTRIPILMHFVEGRSHAEIAAELDLGESAVKMRISRGARRLREIYEDKLRSRDPSGTEGDG